MDVKSYHQKYREEHKLERHEHYKRYYQEKREAYYKPKADYSKSYIFKIVNKETGESYIDCCGYDPQRYVKVSEKLKPLLALWGGNIDILEECSAPDRSALIGKVKEYIKQEPNCKNEQFGRNVKRYLASKSV